MQRKIFKWRLSVPIINGLLALMMALGTFSAAYAQGGNTQVLLPLVHAGQSAEEAPNSSEVQAAGSCYGNAFNVGTRNRGGNVYTTEKIRVSARGSYCNDLNIYADTLAPHTGCMKYAVHIYDRNDNWKRWTGVNWVCRSRQWKVLATNLGNDDRYRITFYQNPGEVRLAD